jgi:hypothetical protein
MNHSRIYKTLSRNIYAQLVAIALGTILGTRLVEWGKPPIKVHHPIEHKCISFDKVITT